MHLLWTQGDSKGAAKLLQGAQIWLNLAAYLAPPAKSSFPIVPSVIFIVANEELSFTFLGLCTFCRYVFHELTEPLVQQLVFGGFANLFFVKEGP